MGTTEALDDGDGVEDVVILGKIGVIEKKFLDVAQFFCFF